jgi:hypothetical protein
LRNPQREGKKKERREKKKNQKPGVPLLEVQTSVGVFTNPDHNWQLIAS